MNKQKLKDALKHNIFPKNFSKKELQGSISNNQNSLFFCYSIEMLDYLIKRGISCNWDSLLRHYKGVFEKTNSLDYKRMIDYILENMDVENKDVENKDLVENVKQHVPP